jgi:ABC-type oligopeptide transport system substrate-binding subunit
MKKILYAATIIALFMLSMQIPNTSAKEGKVVILAGPYDFEEYSQFWYQSYATGLWMAGCDASLYRRDATEDYAFEPFVADGDPVVEVNADGNMTVTVDIRTDVKFSDDNSTLTADDIVYTYKLLLSPQVNTAGYGSLVQRFAANDSIKKIDADTVEFTFKSTYIFYKNTISAQILPKARYEERFNDGDYVYNDADGSDANGAGPYKVYDIDTSDMEITLEQNPYWWGAPLDLDRIVFKKIDEKESAISELAAGNVDIIDSQYKYTYEDLADITGTSTKAVSDPASQNVFYNLLNGKLNGTGTPAGTLEAGKYVRKAISHMIDRDHIVTEIADSMATPANYLMPNVAPGWNDVDFPYRKYNLTLAREYMEMAGYAFSDLGLNDLTDEDWGTTETTDSNNHFGVYMLSPNTNPQRNAWAALLEEELPKIGIYVIQHASTGWGVISPLTFSSNVPPPTGAPGENESDLNGWDLCFMGYSHDLDYNPQSFFAYGGGSFWRPNGGNWCNFRGDLSTMEFENQTYNNFDDMCEAYLNEINATKRADHLFNIQSYLYEWECNSVILYPQSLWAYSTSVTGMDWLMISQADPQWDLVDGPTRDIKEKDGDDGGFGIVAFIMMASVLMAIPIARRRR